MIPVAKPIIGDEELEAVRKVLESGYLAEGKVSRELEAKFSEYIGTKYATVTTNGTTALFTALDAMGIRPGDEVITTPFTFIASANTITQLGAIPIFVDVDPETYNIDPDLIEQAITEKTKAIMPVHIFGNPADMKRIMEIAEAHDLSVLEDACQAHGATIDGKKVGSFGHAAAFSFYATKNMMTGEGGMIVTDDEDLIERAKSIKNHGRGVHGGYSHFRIGYNFRMLDIVSAIGIVQLKRLPGIVKAQQRNGVLYNEALAEIDALKPQAMYPGAKSAYHVYAPRLYSDKVGRDEIIAILKQHNIGSRSVYAVPCHKQGTYANIQEWSWAKFVKYPDYSSMSFPIAEDIGDRHFQLPSHSQVSEEDVKFVVETIRSIFQ
ncbi:MAG: DegT/DnrJ/EryC1/StrS aminotransferase family protein [Candidatus Thorarchaeota archaeon]|nr:DegT/DnrJ/EryC1/StrS aminotransferase family protein [Candidatus Thorarchaeota archaeon]